MEILLTNDDGPDSPLLELVAEDLRERGNLTVVVPKNEQSWTGKSMTRFRELRLERRDDHTHTVDGTPPDCVNVAVHHLYDARPDLVVSGINVGSNTGIGFAFSSGTVGACLEANIIGLPAVALSQILGGGLFFEWTDNKRFPEVELERLRVQTRNVLDAVFGRLFERPGFWKDPVTWNVNIPPETTEDWEVRDTYLSHTFYGSCFKKVGEVFRHDMDPPTVDTREHADEGVVRAGHVSVSRLDIRTFGRLQARDDRSVDHEGHEEHEG